MLISDLHIWVIRMITMAGPMEVRKILTLILIYFYQDNYLLFGKMTTNETAYLRSMHDSLGILASDVDLFFSLRLPLISKCHMS